MHSYPHPRGDASLHLVQLLHGGVGRHGDHGVVQVRAGSPLVADGLLGHEVVGNLRGLSVPPPENLVETGQWERGVGVGGRDRVQLPYLKLVNLSSNHNDGTRFQNAAAPAQRWIGL